MLVLDTAIAIEMVEPHRSGLRIILSLGHFRKTTITAIQAGVTWETNLAGGT
jgi:hypothetical protein